MLYGWMKSIIIYLILSGIVINLAPASNYKKYINFFMGLLLLIIVAQPISYIFNLGEGDVDKLMNTVDIYMNADTSQVEEVRNQSYYEMSLEDSIENSVRELGYDIYKVAVITDTDYKILKCTIYVKDGQSDIFVNDGYETKKHISDVYNVEVDNINIVSR